MFTFILILLFIIPMILIVGINEQEQDFLIKTHEYITDKYEQEFTFQSSYVNVDGNLIVKFETDGTEGIDEWVEVLRYVKDDSICYSDNYNVQIACDIIRNDFYNNIKLDSVTLYVHRPSIVMNNLITNNSTFKDVVNSLDNCHVELSLLVDNQNFKTKEDISNFKENLTNYLFSNYDDVTVHVYIISKDARDIAITKGMPFFYKWCNKNSVIAEDIVIENGVVL